MSPGCLFARVVASLRTRSKPGFLLNSPPLTPKDVYVDFGVRKPHMILVDRAREPVTVKRLRDIGLRSCRIYLEEGCPRHELYEVLKDNQVFTINGRFVNALRVETGKIKSDFNDVFLIRELAQERPQAFRILTPHEKQQIDDEIAYAYYYRLTRLVATLKNHRKSFLRQFGQVPPQLEVALGTLQRERLKAAYYFEKRFEKLARALDIRGLGYLTVGAISAKANPKRFRSLQAYLRYCGLRAEARASGNYDHRIKGIYHQFGRDVIMHRDGTFYPLFLEIKANLRKRFPDYRKGKIDGMARNRLATLLAKHIYRTLQDG